MPEPLQVQTAYSKGKVTELDIQCIPRGLNPCDLEATMWAGLHQTVEGEGFHALAEYLVDQQGFRIPGNEGVFFPVFWQFCAKWGGFSGEIPKDIQQRLKFCGVRMFFESETFEELKKIKDDEHATVYEHVLDYLIAAHGEPEDYGKRTQTIITTTNERIAQPRKRRFNEWRWCSVKGRDLGPNWSCTSSIVLAIDPYSGLGVVLFATPQVYEFAYARQHGGAGGLQKDGSRGDPLYKLLHGLEKYAPVDDRCTGSNLCRPSPPKPMTDEAIAKFRLPVKAGDQD